MRLWQKICICNLLFFLTVYLISGILIIENTKKTAFDRVLQISAGEQTGISSGIVSSVLASRAEVGGDGDTRRKEYIAEYLESRINSRGIYTVIREGGDILYSNLEVPMPVIEDKDYAGALTYRIQEIEEKQYLILFSRLALTDQNIMNIYLRDISDIYADRVKQYAFFARLGLVIAVLMSVGMYFITGHLTKSLRVLTESVRKVGKGNYTERIPIRTKDETGELAASYNEMAEAIEEAIRRLENKTKEQQRFIDNFTHELRTPLTAVVGYADLLRSTSCEEEVAQELGERIFREGKRIEKLSQLMMDLIFLEHNTFELKPCEVGALLTEAADIFGPAVVKADLKLICMPPESPAMVLGERELLLNLLGNLLDNAKKASAAGGTIWLRGRGEKEQVVLEVEDQGKGIPEEDKERVFESFYMVDKVRNRKNNMGIGLGLSICSDIAKIHNAQMELCSEVGKGTLVRVKLLCYKQDTNQF